MGRFKTAGAPDASLRRRDLLIGGGALALAGCGRQTPMTASSAPPLKMNRLTETVGAVAAKAAPGMLGAALMDLASGEVWTLNGERPFPMQSLFKAPLGAAVLAEAEAGRLSLDETVTLEETDLSPPWSPVADLWPARRNYTLAELLVAAVGESDNTAADLLMRRIGGPGALTAWLTSKRVDEVRVDRYERELQPQSVGLLSFRPAWKGEAAWVAAMSGVPEAERRAALSRYLEDPRDTATPRGFVGFLQALDSGQLVGPASAQRLLRIMSETSTGAGRLKAGLPAGTRLAHKTGTARTVLGVNPAINDAGIFTLKDGRSFAAAVFLSGSNLVEGARDAVIADVAREMAAAVA